MAAVGSASKKRKVELTYSSLPQDLDVQKVPDWRTGKFSDWRLHLGEASFTVHRVVVGCGERASAFLHTAFNTAIGADGPKTDLSALLPQKVWPLFPEVLDFVYVGREPYFHAKNLVALIVWADVLQIKFLFQLAEEAVDDLLDADVAMQVLIDSQQLLGSGMKVREQLESSSAACMAESLAMYSPKSLLNMPVGCMDAVFSRSTAYVVKELKEQDIRVFLSSVLEQFPEERLQAAFWHVVVCEIDKICYKALDSKARYEALSRARSELLPNVVAAVNILLASDSLQWPIQMSHRNHVSKFPDQVQDNIESKALGVLAEQFPDTSIDLLQRLSGRFLGKLLRDDKLACVHEDEVYDVILKLASGLPEDQAQELWKTCRFGALSSQIALAASALVTIPSGVVQWSREYFGKARHPKHSWVEHLSLRPRYLFNCLTCVIIMNGRPAESERFDPQELDEGFYQGENCRYDFLVAVATELRSQGAQIYVLYPNEEDEDREFEFSDRVLVLASPLLSPKHFGDFSRVRLNCHAAGDDEHSRVWSSRRQAHEFGDAYVPNSYGYPQWLLNGLKVHVEKGGALVILPDAGGLCPRVGDQSGWRAGGYEPFMLGCYGKKDDDCSTNDDLWGVDGDSSMKMTCDGNTRLFLGVENVKGPELQVAWGEPREYDSDDEGALELSKYPSKILHGSRIHAEWSNPSLEASVPCVVEHPQHAVLSIFFGGQPQYFMGDWRGVGRIVDDRLRLVVNSLLVMKAKAEIILKQRSEAENA